MGFLSLQCKVIYFLLGENESRKSNIGQCSAEMRLGFSFKERWNEL